MTVSALSPPPLNRPEFAATAAEAGREPLATLGLRDKKVRAGKCDEAIAQFVGQVRAALDGPAAAPDGTDQPREAE